MQTHTHTAYVHPPPIHARTHTHTHFSSLLGQDKYLDQNSDPVKDVNPEQNSCEVSGGLSEDISGLTLLSGFTNP